MQEGSIVKVKDSMLLVLNKILIGYGQKELVKDQEYMVTSVFDDIDFPGRVGIKLLEYPPDLSFNARNFEELLPPFSLDISLKEVEVDKSILTISMCDS